MNRHSFLLTVCGLAACAAVPDTDEAPEVSRTELIEGLKKAIALLMARDATIAARDETIKALENRLDVGLNCA